MSQQTLKLADIVVNKKEYHASKQAIALPLYIILPQLSGYTKYFDNGGKNMNYFK